MKEESHVDGNQQTFPLAIGHFKVGEELRASGNALVFGFLHAVEEQGAGIACAKNLPGGELDQMRMVMTQARAAELAELDRARGRNCAHA